MRRMDVVYVETPDPYVVPPWSRFSWTGKKWPLEVTWKELVLALA